MGKPRDPARYPLEYETLVDQVLARGSIAITRSTKQKAEAFRFDFYGWAKALELESQRIDGPRALHYDRLARKAKQICLRFIPPSTIELVTRDEDSIAQELRAQGFGIKIPELQVDSSGRPHIKDDELRLSREKQLFAGARPQELEDVLNKLGYIGAQLRQGQTQVAEAQPAKDFPPQSLAELMKQQALKDEEDSNG